MDQKFFLAEFENRISTPNDATSTHREQEATSRKLVLCSGAKARGLLSEEDAIKLEALPLSTIPVNGEEVFQVAVVKGTETDTTKILKFALGMEVRAFGFERAAIREAIHIAYRGDVRRLLDGVSRLESTQGRPQAIQTGLELRAVSAEPAKFIANLIEYCVLHGATGIHLLPRHDGGYVRMRLNGAIHNRELPICSLRQHAEMVARLKVLAGVALIDMRTPSDGSFWTEIGDRRVNIRLSTIPTVHGEKASLRIQGSDAFLDLDSLGFSAKVRTLINQTTGQMSGAIICAGPTGGGKSSTLYAIVNSLAKAGLNISTVEDPVEQIIAGVSQTQVLDAAGLTFAKALRAILRQDPDVIMVGELRDPEGAAIAFEASLTGHLLLTSTHAGSAVEVWSRLKSLGLDPGMLSHTVRLIVWQTLVPTLCLNCRVLDLEETNNFGFQVFKPVGCNVCDYSGAKGRAPVVEILKITHSGSNSNSDPNLEQCGDRCCDMRICVNRHEAAIELMKEGAICAAQAREFNLDRTG